MSAFLRRKSAPISMLPGEPLRYRPAEVGAGRLLLPLSASGGIQAHCQTAPRAPYRPRALHRRVCRPPALRDESRRRQGGSLWPAEAYLQYLAQNAEKHLAFDELFDVRAVRIVAERLQDCYAALGIVHTHYRHLPDEFDDYVANPKPNGYQSIHTVVLGPSGKTVEIQIRTRQMHEDAELGVAAHWKYKEGAGAGTSGGRGYEDRIAWLRKLIAWQEEMADSGEMLDEVRSQVFDDRVYVFTPKGDVVDLPAGSTPLDFAYHIHSDVGHRCIGAKIGGRIVPFTYQLQMGDQIEIITQKQPNPSRDWLNPNLGYVTTSRGRSKIHAWFRKQDRDKNILAGRQILDDELEHLGISLKDAEKHLLPRYNFNELDELLAAIGGGDIRLNQMVNFPAGAVQ